MPGSEAPYYEEVVVLFPAACSFTFSLGLRRDFLDWSSVLGLALLDADIREGMKLTSQNSVLKLIPYFWSNSLSISSIIP